MACAWFVYTVTSCYDGTGLVMCIQCMVLAAHKAPTHM